ncbi:MAG: hypothetical protein WHT08_16895 [Bryobacteraceae bacterium]|jgi:methylmalonyl-CoA carboxyltransferase large subunit
MSRITLQSLSQEVEALRQHLAALAEKLAELERAAAAAPSHAVEVPAEPPPPPAEEISEETLAAISAAVAAFLGKRPHIRAIRLVSSPAWAQQGRVSIQASHRISPQHHQHRVR